MRKHITQPLVLTGFAVANVAAMLIMAATKYAMNYYSNDGGLFISSEFVILPMLMGIISAWFWRSAHLTSRMLSWYSAYNALLGILLSYIILKEGVICLIIVSPLIICFVICGAFAGRRMFKKSNTTLNVSIISLFTLVFITDALSKHNYENMVADQMVINAPPAEVWKHVVAFKPITQQNTYWLFNIGMPSPVATTVTGYYKGAGRKCIFSNGYVFGEKIVTFEPGKNLTFDIIDQPRDPEIMGHIDILSGQFLLKDNGNGTTRLTGNSWYKLYVFPVWYYDIWAKSITRNVHLRVMEHIKQLSEHP